LKKTCAASGLGWHPESLPQAVLSTVLFGAVGILLSVGGFKVFDKLSPFDLERAWPCYSYWIVCVREGRTAGSRSWMRSEDGKSFSEEDIRTAGG